MIDVRLHDATTATILKTTTTKKSKKMKKSTTIPSNLFISKIKSIMVRRYSFSMISRYKYLFFVWRRLNTNDMYTYRYHLTITIFRGHSTKKKKNMNQSKVKESIYIKHPKLMAIHGSNTLLFMTKWRIPNDLILNRRIPRNVFGMNLLLVLVI